MMLSRMFPDVVSVARPGSSDGGSAPQFTVITCFAARSDEPAAAVVAPEDSLSSPPPPHPAATRLSAATSAAAQNQAFLLFIPWFPSLWTSRLPLPDLHHRASMVPFQTSPPPTAAPCVRQRARDPPGRSGGSPLFD